MSAELHILSEDLLPSFALAMGRLTPLYALCLLATALYWLVQSPAQGRKGLWPRLGLLLPLGLAALLAAQLLQIPGLFGLGLGLALIALYAPLPALRVRPPQWGWGVVGVVVGAYCLSAAYVDHNLWALLLGVVTALQSMYTLLWLRGYWRAQTWKAQRALTQAATLQPPLLPLWVRTQAALVPDPPDLELSLQRSGARLHNISGKRLVVLGWSAAYLNEWRPMYPGAAAYLPVGEYTDLRGWPQAAAGQPEQYSGGAYSGGAYSGGQRSGGRPQGLRVWYARQGEDAVYLFRADWVQPVPNERGERVLN